MKFFDKVIYWLLALIGFIVAILLFMIAINPSAFQVLMTNFLTEVEKGTNYVFKFRNIFILALVVLLLSIKGLFFQSKKKSVETKGILLKNNNGRLSITEETLNKLVEEITKEVPEIEAVKSYISLDEENELVILVDTVIYKDVQIKEVSKKIQEDIKAVIKHVTDINVSRVDINVKNVSNRTCPHKTEKVNKKVDQIKEISEETKKIENKKTENVETKEVLEDKKEEVKVSVIDSEKKKEAIPQIKE